MACVEMKQSHKCWRLRAFIGNAMYPVIHAYDEQAFNYMSEGTEKTNSIVNKSLRPVPSQGMVKQAKKHGGFRPL